VRVDAAFWMYCPKCGDRVNGAAPAACSQCGTGMRIWKAKDGSPPPEDVSTIEKLGTGMSTRTMVVSR